MSLSAIPHAVRAQIFERAAGRCEYCRLSQIGQVATFHVNHIVPRSKGGTTTDGNLALQCPYCSLHKSDKLQVLDGQTGQPVVLFHPRSQNWSEHFEMTPAAIYVGKTETGRATIDALRMNDVAAVLARAIQMHLGLLS